MQDVICHIVISTRCPADALPIALTCHNAFAAFEIAVAKLKKAISKLGFINQIDFVKHRFAMESGRLGPRIKFTRRHCFCALV